MKSLKWAATLGIVAICVILFLNRDDVMRYQKMRQMLYVIRPPSLRHSPASKLSRHFAGIHPRMRVARDLGENSCSAHVP